MSNTLRSIAFLLFFVIPIASYISNNHVITKHIALKESVECIKIEQGEPKKNIMYILEDKRGSDGSSDSENADSKPSEVENEQFIKKDFLLNSFCSPNLKLLSSPAVNLYKFPKQKIICQEILVVPINHLLKL